MKKTKLLSVVSPVALVSLLTLTGCNGFKPGEADTHNLDVNIETRGVTISLWTGFGQSITSTLENIIEGFEEKTGITVEHESKGGYDNLQNAIELAATTRSYANVAVGYPDHFAGYINSNIQLRLDGLIGNDHNRKAGKDEEGFDVDKDGIRLLDYDDFYDDYKPENETLEFNKDGKGYKLGLPFNKSSEAMVYNATFFDWAQTQATLKDKIFVPTTWAEVLSVGKEVKKLFAEKAVYGKILGTDSNVYADASTFPAGVSAAFDATKVASADEFKLISYDSTPNMFITLVRQFGGTYTEIDKTKTGVGYAAFNDAAYRQKTLDAMAMIRGLDAEGLVGIPASFGESLYCSTPFKNGRSLLNIGSTAGVSNAITGNFITKAAAIPQNEKISSSKFVISQGTNLALFNKGTDAEKVAAWKLMVYLSQQVNGEFAARTGYFPTCESATNSEVYQEYLDSFGAGEILQKECGILNAYTYGNASKGWTRFVDPGFQGSSAIRTEVGNIPGYILLSSDYANDQAILDAVYAKLPDYIRK